MENVVKYILCAFLLVLGESIGTLSASDISVDGIWYDFNSNTQTAVVTYLGANCYSYDNEYSGDVVIPDSVIYEGVTYSVKSIKWGAFQNCIGLTSVIIPNSVTNIENYVFSDCSGLISVTIGNGVTSIGDCSFKNCTSLTTINIPHSVTTIKGGAFQNCIGLTSVDIGNSVTYIGCNAFQDCAALTSVVIPNSVTIVGDKCFSGCSSLTSVIIPDGIIYIYEYTFYGCTSLTHVTIPNSVQYVYNYSFQNCTGLISITCEATTPPRAGMHAFYNVEKTIPLYVPALSIEDYKAAQGWKDFTNIQAIEDVSTDMEQRQSNDAYFQSAKVLQEGKLFIRHGERIYTLTGQEVK